MRVRVAIRTFNALIRERRFLNPFKYRWFAWQLWSHKVLRYASPILWLGALAANVVLAQYALHLVLHPREWEVGMTVKPELAWSAIYLVLLIAQTGLLLAGAVGFILQDRQVKPGPFGKPYYFLLTNLASLIATLRYLQGERMVVWNPIR